MASWKCPKCDENITVSEYCRKHGAMVCKEEVLLADAQAEIERLRAETVTCPDCGLLVSAKYTEMRHCPGCREDEQKDEIERLKSIINDTDEQNSYYGEHRSQRIANLEREVEKLRRERDTARSTMQKSIRLGCTDCDRVDFDGVGAIPDDWALVGPVTVDYTGWETHLGVCPDCIREKDE